MTGPMHNTLLRLGQSIGDAAVTGLSAVVEETVSVTEVTTLADSGSLHEQVVAGIIVADASSVDGAAGRSLLLLTPADAERLSATTERPVRDATSPTAVDDVPAEPDAPPQDEAANEADAEPDPSEPAAEADEDPGEPAADSPAATPSAAVPSVEEPVAPGSQSPPTLDGVAAIADAINEAAGNALSILLGQATRYEPAQATVVEDPRFVVRPGPVQAVCAVLQVGEVSMRLIQFAPNALVMRAARAYEDLAQDLADLGPGNAAGPSEQTLSGIRLRVWAELGRTELALSDALSLPLGTVVELDREADAPVDLVVNGMRFGAGRLIVTDEGEWALTLDEVGAVSLT